MRAFHRPGAALDASAALVQETPSPVASANANPSANLDTAQHSHRIYLGSSLHQNPDHAGLILEDEATRPMHGNGSPSPYAGTDLDITPMISGDTAEISARF